MHDLETIKRLHDEYAERARMYKMGYNKGYESERLDPIDSIGSDPNYLKGLEAGKREKLRNTNESVEFYIGKWRGEDVIFGPGGPFLYAKDQHEQMVAECAEMNARNLKKLDEVGSVKGEISAGLDRLKTRGRSNIAASFGNQSAVGRLQAMDAAKRLRNEWFRYKGAKNLETTLGNLSRWLKGAYDYNLHTAASQSGANASETQPTEPTEPTSPTEPGTPGNPPLKISPDVYQGAVKDGVQNDPAELQRRQAAKDGGETPTSGEAEPEDAKTVAAEIQKDMKANEPDRKVVMQQVYYLLKIAQTSTGHDKVAIANYLERLRSNPKMSEKVPELRNTVSQEYIEKMKQVHEQRVLELTQILVEYDIRDSVVVNELYNQIFEKYDPDDPHGLNTPLSRSQFDEIITRAAADLLYSGKMSFENGSSTSQSNPTVVDVTDIRGNTQSSFNERNFIKLKNDSGINFESFQANNAREHLIDKPRKDQDIEKNIAIAFAQTINLRQVDENWIDKFSRLLGDYRMDTYQLKSYQDKVKNRPITKGMADYTKIAMAVMKSLKLPQK